MWSRLETWWIWVGIAVRASRVVGVAPVRNIFGQLVEKVCGVSTRAAGVKLGASLVDRIHVNMGTITSFPLQNHIRWTAVDRFIANRGACGGAEPL
jgi:hypothetical protein